MVGGGTKNRYLVPIRRQRILPTVKAQGRIEPLTPRQQRLLDALETIFLGEGFSDVTVAELARRLRCSRRSLYELAPSKEALFLRVLDRYLSRLREQGRQATLGVAPERAFEPYLMPAVEAARKLSAAVMRDITAWPPADEMWRAHTRERMQGLRTLVERCVELKIFRGIDPYLVAEVMAASLRRICEPNFLADSGMTYREAVSELYGLLLHGLVRPDQKPGQKPGRPRTASPAHRSSSRPDELS